MPTTERAGPEEWTPASFHYLLLHLAHSILTPILQIHFLLQTILYAFICLSAEIMTIPLQVKASLMDLRVPQMMALNAACFADVWAQSLTTMYYVKLDFTEIWCCTPQKKKNKDNE